jgi:flagellar basal body-associated protein FliL
MPAVKEKTKDEADAAAADVKKKLDIKSPKFLIVLVVVIAAGYFGYSKFAAPPASTKPVAPKPGQVVKMDKQIVNLSGGHLLQIEADLQLADGKSLPTTSEKLPQTSQAEEIVIDTYSDQSLGYLAKAANRDALKTRLLAGLQKAYGKDVVYGVFLPVFTTQ